MVTVDCTTKKSAPASSAILAKRSARWGMADTITGLVAPAATLTEAAVISHCKGRLEEFMVPRQVE